MLLGVGVADRRAETTDAVRRAKLFTQEETSRAHGRFLAQRFVWLRDQVKARQCQTYLINWTRQIKHRRPKPIVLKFDAGRPQFDSTSALRARKPQTILKTDLRGLDRSRPASGTLR